MNRLRFVVAVMVLLGSAIGSTGEWSVDGRNHSRYTDAEAEAALADELAGKQDADTDLTDLADGSLTGSKVGAGIAGDNITDGTVDESELAPNSVKASELDVSDVSDDIAGDIAEGELADSTVVSADIKDGTIDVLDLDAGVQGSLAESDSAMQNTVDDADPDLGGDLDLNEHYIELVAAPSADDTGSGIMVAMTVDANGTGVGAALHLDADGNWIEADADATATMPCTALALETGTGAKKVLLRGFIRNDGWTFGSDIGKPVFVSATTGAITITSPASGDFKQFIGVVTHADRIFFDPSPILIGID
ncbi:MAG: hypothetical protein HN919_18565 [Verrucomicrobia bacterium]|jgi:hypothetical protein|nr:hypothetical protein [Verrucomicrobiota bacterium]